MTPHKPHGPEQIDPLLLAYRLDPEKAHAHTRPDGPLAEALLVRALYHQSPVAFLGSGLSSAAADLPVWADLPRMVLNKLAATEDPGLLATLRRRIGLDDATTAQQEPDRKLVNPLPGTPNPPRPPVDSQMALSLIRQAVGKDIREHVAEEWRARQSGAARQAERTVYDGLLETGFFTRFVTTNYDTLLEQAIARSQGEAIDPQAGTSDRLPECAFTQHIAHFIEQAHFCVSSVDSAAPLVFHCHGYFGDPNSLVLTDHDYAVHYYDRREAGREPGHLQRVLDNILRSNTVVFVGFSLDDREIQRILRPLGAARYQSESRGHLFLIDPEFRDPKRNEAAINRAEFLWSEFRIITVAMPSNSKDTWADFYCNSFERLRQQYDETGRYWAGVPVTRCFQPAGGHDANPHNERQMTLWASRELLRQMNGELNSSLSPTLRKLSAALIDFAAHMTSHPAPEQPVARLVWVHGPAGSGKLRLTREVYGAAKAAGCQVAYVNLNRVHDFVSVIDRILAVFENTDNVLTQGLPRAQRLQAALSGLGPRRIVFLCGCDALMDHRERDTGATLHMAFALEILHACMRQEGSGLVVATSRTPLDAEQVLRSMQLEVVLRPNSDGSVHHYLADDNSRPLLTTIAARPGTFHEDQRRNNMLTWLEGNVKLAHLLPSNHVPKTNTPSRNRPVSVDAFEAIEQSCWENAQAMLRKRTEIDQTMAQLSLNSVILCGKAVIQRLSQYGQPVTHRCVYDVLADIGTKPSIAGLPAKAAKAAILAVLRSLLKSQLLVRFLPEDYWVRGEGSTSPSSRTLALDRDYAQYVMRRHLGRTEPLTSGVDVSDFNTSIGISSPSDRREGSLIHSVYRSMLAAHRQPCSQLEELDRLRHSFAVMRGRMPAVTATDWEPGNRSAEPSPAAASMRDCGGNAIDTMRARDAWQDAAGFGPHDWYVSRMVDYIGRLKRYCQEYDLGFWNLRPPVTEGLGAKLLWTKWIRGARHELGPLHAADYLWLYNELAHSLILNGQMREAESISRITARIADAVDMHHGYRPYVVQARLKAIQAMINLGKLAEAQATIDECRPYARHRFGRDEELWLRLEGFGTWICHLRGEFDLADRQYQETVEKLRSENGRAAAFFGSHYGQMLLSMGQHAKAREQFLCSEAIARTVDLPVSMLYVQLGMVRYYRQIGDVGRAMHALRSPYETIVSYRLRRLEADARYEMSAILASSGDRERAKREAVRGLHVANRYSPGLAQTKLLIAVGRAHLPSARSRLRAASGNGTTLEHVQEYEHDISYLTEEERKAAWAFLTKARLLATQQHYWIRARVADRLLAESGLSAYFQSHG